MDKFFKQAERMLEDPSDVVILTNKALGRNPELSNSSDRKEAIWPDSSEVFLPPFLAEVINMQYRSVKPSKSKDLIVRAIIKDISHHGTLLSSIESVMTNVITDINEGSHAEDSFERGVFSSFISEVSKQQLLVVAPIFGHALAGGGHPVNLSIPGTFSVDLDRSKAIGKAFAAKFGVIRKTDFTVPASTSQGMTLKTLRDTPQWRIYSKALLGNLALKCKSRADYDKVIAAMNDVFESRGYDPVADCFYLGMRKQGMRKDEPVSSDYGLHGGGDYDVSFSKAIQGRIRGIFPPSEFVKIFFKPFAEGIKSALFQKTYSFGVNLNLISAKLHALALLSEQHQLKDEEGGYYCFYDLSAMDTTTHEGFLNAYHSFCSGVFPDFEHIEGDTVRSCDLIFPQSPSNGSMIRQRIGGRSTLSGQPDVTTKNNVAHVLAMIESLSHVTGCSYEAVSDSLFDGGSLEGWPHPLIAHIHGDDTMLYFSPNREDYISYFNKLAEQGFATSYEQAPIFLKKMPAFNTMSGHNGMYDQTVAELLDISHSVLSDMRNELSDINYSGKIISCLEGMNLNCVSTDYNVSYMGGLNPSVGSLIKNRFGEYETKEFALSVMSLHDTAKMMHVEGPLFYHWIRYWAILYFTSLRNADSEVPSDLVFSCSNNTPESIVIWKEEECLAFYVWLTSPNLSITLKDMLIELAASSATKARTIRNALERLYYASGQEFADITIDTLFGSLELSPSDLGDSFDISKLSLDDHLKLVCDAQAQILDSGGNVPGMADDLFKIASRIFSNIGSNN